MGACCSFLKAGHNNWAHLTIHELLLGMPVAVCSMEPFQSFYMPHFYSHSLLCALVHMRLPGTDE